MENIVFRHYEFKSACFAQVNFMGARFFAAACLNATLSTNLDLGSAKPDLAKSAPPSSLVSTPGFAPAILAESIREA